MGQNCFWLVRRFAFSAWMLWFSLSIAEATPAIVGKSGITLDRVPDGLVVVLDSPRHLLMNGIDFGCGWSSSRVSRTPGAHELPRTFEDTIRAMTGVSSLTFLKKRNVSRRDTRSSVVEFVADAVSEKGAIARRVVAVVDVYSAQKKVVTGFCIAPGSIYDARLPELSRLAGAARPAESVRHRKDD